MCENKIDKNKARNIIDTQLENFVLNQKQFYLYRALTYLSAELFLLLLLIFGLFITFKPTLLIVLFFWIISLAVIVITSIKLIKPILKKYNTLQKALLVEQNFGDHHNLVVNSIQLVENSENSGEIDKFSQVISEKVTIDSAQYLLDRSQEFKSKFAWSKIYKRLSVSLSLFVLTVLMLVIFTQEFSNSIQHFFNPTGDVVTLNWEIQPGNIKIFKGDNLSISAIPNLASHGDSAFIADNLNTKSTENRPMNFNGNSYIYQYKNVHSDFSYRIASGADKSEEYFVKVIELPEITRLDLQLKHPDYTKMPTEIFKDVSGDITGLADTQAKITVTCNQEIKTARLIFNSGESLPFYQHSSNLRVFAVDFKLSSDAKYKIALQNSKDQKNRGFNERVIKVIPDLQPAIQVLSPVKSIHDVALNVELPIKLRVSDDFGIKLVKFVMKKNDEPETEFPIFSADEQRVHKQISTILPVKFPTEEFAEGDNITLFFRAIDYHPKRNENADFTESRKIHLRIIALNQELQTQQEFLEKVTDKLNSILLKQIKNQAETVSLKNKLPQIIYEEFLTKSTRLKQTQIEIRAEILALAEMCNSDDFPNTQINAAEFLDKLAGADAYVAIKMLEDAEKLNVSDEQTQKYTDVITTQDEIINKLKELLKTLSDNSEFVRKPEKAKDNFDLSRKFDDKIESLKDKLSDFLEDQKRIIELSEELGKKSTEDWTEEDDKNWEESKQAEDDWAKFFKDMKEDLSKLPDQDFSSSEIAEELNQIYQEVRNASEEIAKKNITIAVTNEQAGLELAEELENNLERWLMDRRDNVKWEMEEPTQDYDVPLSDLPDELEDIIGDLIDEEEDIIDEVDDVSSSWMDNLDAGAGWDAQDGPISNMSAKGVTGNQMPNSSEIGGRAGEGRTGRSSGQFVTPEAEGGRGGRQTPTRDDGTPPETGQIKDKSNDPVGGATGGGKLSGDGGDGVRGNPNPELKEAMRRLQGKQSDVLNMAEKLKRQLDKRRYPTEVLDETIQAMKLLQDELQEFQRNHPENVRNRIEKIVAQLHKADTSVKKSAELYRDLTRSLPKELKDQVTSAQDEKSPQEYKDLLDDYFRRLLNSK